MPKTPTLSLCMIAKNEEAHLSRCLESVRGLVDEIVFVDTGSTDRTVEIARSFDARIFHFAWQDDFSLARNVSLEQATGEWILVLDADESIAARDHARIRELLRREDLNAFIVFQRHYLTSTVVGWQPGPGGYDEGKPYPGFLDVDCRRLFRNRPWLRFQHPVHEELLSTDPSHPLAQIHGDWVIHHFGKLASQDLIRAKGEAYLRIGVKKAEDRPRDPLAHFELGIQYSELDKPAEALASFERVMALSPGYRDAQLRIALAHARLGQHESALRALRQAKQALPQLAAAVALEEGNSYRALGDDAAAERAFRRALARNPAFAVASFNLALLYQSQNRLAEALTCLDRGLDECPGHVELRSLRAYIRRAAGDDAGALRDLEHLGSHGGALRLRARILAQQRRFHEARACLAELGDASDAELAGLRGAVALGLGEFAEAVARLRQSLEAQASPEAALNLSTALEAQGDRAGALEAAAEALRLAPDAPVVRTRVKHCAADTFRHRLATRDSTALTIFFYQPHSIAFDGRTPRTRGLGGTESAIVYLAEGLARLGHRVVVFNSCDEPAQVNAVEYARWETLPVRSVADRPEVLVGVRFWQLIGQVRLAPLQIFWTGDAFDQPFLEQLAEPGARAEIDFFMLQSDWQEQTFQARHRVPAWQIGRTRLGAAASASEPPVRPAATATRARRLAYASTPFRGLDVLLDVFPKIRAACPDAELDVFSSMRVYGVAEADDRKQYGALYKKAEQPGVNLIGSVPQLELARRLQESRLLAYPNHYAETFCIAAVEAQAAGCGVITSQLGALPETVGDAGVCLPGDPQNASYRQAFIDACVELLTDDERWSAMSERALARASSYTWSVIAEGWNRFCRAALTTEPAVLERVAVHLAAGREGLAQRMLQREKCPAGVSSEAWDALERFVAWRVSGGEAPSQETLRSIALHFRSLRRSELMESPALAVSSRQ
ncbi:MAG TPA: glycosyltransferase [Vicinamibacterales bacterium]|nr:glycosyltransferase [Vicinamibacterales bacterium]